MNDAYEITVWVDTNGRTHTAPQIVHAGNLAEAKAKFKALHRDCKSVTGAHKK